MSKEDTPYREGDQEDTPEQQEEPVGVPTIGFLVLLLADGKTEVVTDLPSMNFARKADLRDVRDLAHAVYEDSRAELTAKASAMHFTQTMAKAAQMQQSRNIQAQIGDLKAQAAHKKIKG